MIHGEWNTRLVSSTDRRRRLTAVLRRRNYRAFVNSLRVYRHPLDGLNRYVRGSGSYPWSAELRTPVGPVAVHVPHPHDVRTVNEIFLRKDYGYGAPRVVVDVGANIGVSAVYFLTRRTDSVVHCWEPHPGNQVALERNVEAFDGRCVVHGAALAPEAGSASFYAEQIGRYSALAEFAPPHATAEEITVPCEEVNAALQEVIDAHGSIDLLKVDTEGSELSLLQAIRPDVWDGIRAVVYEQPGHVVHLSGPEAARALGALA